MDNTVQLSGYEEIAKHLQENGFEDKETEFVKEIHNKQTIIINGQQMENDNVETITLKKLGTGILLNPDGTAKSEKVWGFSIIIQDMHQYDVWAKNWEDFQKLTNIN